MINLLNNKKTMVILSVVVAALLWVYVVSDQNPKTFAPVNDIPVKLINEETLGEKGLVISNPQEYTINIRVYGRKNQLYKINKNNIRVEADLSRLNSKGSHFLPLSIYGIPEEVEISSKNPDTIEVVLDQIVTQERNVRIKIIGNPIEGMASMSYIANPSKVAIEGAETVLESVSEVIAEVDISDANSEINKSLPLKAVDSNGREISGVKILPETVDVTIPIGVTKTVDVKTQIVGDIPEGYIITDIITQPHQVIVGANSEKLDDIISIFTEKVDVQGKTSTFEKKVKLLLPQGVEVINGEATTMVKVHIQPYTEKTFEINNIEIRNLRNDMVLQEDIESTILVTLKGTKKEIEKIKKEDISVHLDASRLREGSHEVTPKIDIPDNIILEGFKPNTIIVNLVKKEEEVIE